MQVNGKAIYYGWWIVAVSALGLVFSIGPVVFFTLGVFLKPLGGEMHWTRAQISMAFMLCTLAQCLALPVIGRGVDAWGARRVAIPSLIFFGCSLAALYLLTPSLLHLYVAFVLIGLAGSGSGPLPYARVLSEWFDQRRGLALGVAMAGVGLGTVIMPALAQHVVDTLGWRRAYGVLGLLVMVIAVPLVALFLKENPAAAGLDDANQPDGSSSIDRPTRGLTRKAATKTADYWTLIVAFFLASTAAGGCVVHLVPLLTDHGMAPAAAARIASLAGVAVVAGRLGAGYLLDSTFAPIIGASFFAALAVGVLLLRLGDAAQVGHLAAFMIGLGLGAEVDLIAYLVSRYFGLIAFGEIYGYVFRSFVIGAGIGPVIMGRIFDLTGAYDTALAMLAGIALLASLLLLRLGPYRYVKRLVI